MKNRIDLFGLQILNEPLDLATDRIIEAGASNVRQTVFFANAHCVNVAARDDAYFQTLRAAGRVYADGVGMALAAELAGTPLLANVNGTDMFPALCERAAAQKIP